jgi:hypothetical protein
VIPSIVSAPTCHQQHIIIGVDMANVGTNSEFDRLQLKFFGRSAAANSARMLSTGMFSYDIGFINGAGRKMYQNLFSEPIDVLAIDLFSILGGLFPLFSPFSFVGTAFFSGSF